MTTATATAAQPKTYRLKRFTLKMVNDNPCPYITDQEGRITASRDINAFLRKVWDMDTIDYQESFYVVFLNKGNRITGYSLLSIGGSAGTVVDTKLLFITALNAGAAAIIVAHNHPSGSLTPSQADIDLTRRIKKAGELLDLQLLDHLILAPAETEYYSFADEGNI